MIAPCPFPTTSSTCRASAPTRWPRARARRERKISRRPYRRGDGLSGWLDGLPRILAAGDFRAVVERLVEARRSGGGIIWGFGAHVLKTGLSPVLVDLMRRGFVSALATNGAGIIHDFEIALAGSTSEDVDEALGPGRFGMAEETGDAAQPRDHRRRRRRPGHRPGRRRVPAPDRARRTRPSAWRPRPPSWASR